MAPARRSRPPAPPEIRSRGQPLNLLYVSNGNIPSRWAHTVQTMRMSEALANQVPRFALLIACDVLGLLRSVDPIFHWYGITRPFEIHRVPIALRITPLSELSNVRPFARWAQAYARWKRPRVLYTRCHESALFGLEDGFPVVFETHDGPGHPKTMRYIRQFAEFPNLRGIVTTSPVLEEAFVAEGIAPEKILVRPNGVDLAHFAPADRAAARDELGLDRERFLVVYVGSLQPHKGIATLLEAARLLPEAHLLLIGGDADQLARWSAPAAECPNVSLQGFVPNAAVPRYLAAADVSVVPNSRSDRTAAWTYSLKLYESLAARRPTIVSDIPSLRSVVSDGEEGLVVPPDDARALADAIRRLQRDPALRERLAARGFEAMKDCTWDARAEAVLRHFAPELLAGRPAVDPGE